MEKKVIQTATAALIAGLALTVMHLLAVWSNSEQLHKLSKPPQSYVVGVAILGVPYVVLLIMWNEQQAAIAFAAVIVSGGLPVIVGHFAKKFQTLWRENEILREGLDDGRRDR